MKIRFIKDVMAETEGRNKGTVHAAGTELTLSTPSALRWLRRGVAVEVAAVPFDRPMAARSPVVVPEPAAVVERNEDGDFVIPASSPWAEPEPEEAPAEPEAAFPEPEPAEPAEKPKPRRGRPRKPRA